MTDDARRQPRHTDPHAPATPASAAHPATVSSTAYGLRIVAGILLVVVFGGLPTVVDGRPWWAALLGLIGVLAGAALIGLAVNAIIRERRELARARAGATAADGR